LPTTIGGLTDYQKNEISATFYNYLLDIFRKDDIFQ
jgi:hypothetical protein